MQPQLPPHVAKNIDGFTGRTWLLPKLLEWWDQSEERLFLLTGGPGTGKSMIMAWLAGFGPEPADAAARAQLARLREQVKAAHFCQAESRNISPQAFAEGIANQLSAGTPGFADALKATLFERIEVITGVARRRRWSVKETLCGSSPKVCLQERCLRGKRHRCAMRRNALHFAPFCYHSATCASGVRASSGSSTVVNF